MTCAWSLSISPDSHDPVACEGRETYVFTHHGGDCSSDGEFRHNFVFSYIMVADSKQAETKTINKFHNCEVARELDNLHRGKT
jgi:hypothetical protein